jgi:hypothetical protein
MRTPSHQSTTAASLYYTTQSTTAIPTCSDLILDPSNSERLFVTAQALTRVVAFCFAMVV